MGVILRSADIVISKKTQEDIYEIKININKNSKFWKSFPWERLNIIRFKFSEEKTVIRFSATSVETLSQFIAQKARQLSYDNALGLFLDIGNQMETLEKKQLGIPQINIDDIIVVNANTFFYINQDKILPINNENMIPIEIPITKNKFSSPELKAIKSLPNSIPFQSGIFSLAALTSFCLSADDNDDYSEILQSISTTPLYYALLRCLHKNPQKRFYLMI